MARAKWWTSEPDTQADRAQAGAPPTPATWAKPWRRPQPLPSLLGAGLTPGIWLCQARSAGLWGWEMRLGTVQVQLLPWAVRCTPAGLGGLLGCHVVQYQRLSSEVIPQPPMPFMGWSHLDRWERRGWVKMLCLPGPQQCPLTGPELARPWCDTEVQTGVLDLYGTASCSGP